MQDPQYSFNAKQSSGALAEGYSVFQNNPSVADTQKVNQQSPLAGKTHNLSDQAATTWQWGSQREHSHAALPIEAPPRAEQLPANVQSFAPPADLGQLQRVQRPQIEQQFTSDMYKSPIDRPYVGSPRKTVEELESTAQLDHDQNETTHERTLDSASPERDEVTEVGEFLPRVGATDSLLAESSLPEVPNTGKQVIVLRSQSAEELAKARAREANSKKPDAQLLTPNFETYVGSPVLDTTRDVYQDQTQWKAYTPKSKEIELPPPAVFESLPVDSTPAFSAKNPVVEFSPPAPNNHAFEPAQEMAALPEPPPAPTPKFEVNLFQARSAPAKSEDAFDTASVEVESSSWNNRSVNQVSAAKVEARQPSYRFERYETDTDVAANTTAMTVAHTTPVTPTAQSEAAWLSPWWMLACLIPFAMYLMTRREHEVDQYDGVFDDVGERPRLPPEMIENPGYSKSDAIYGDKDDYFASAQLFAKGPKSLSTDRLPMATHLKAARHSAEDIADSLPTEKVSTDSVSGLHFASSNSVQTDTDLDGSASPNFRSQPDQEELGESDMPDWLN